MVKCEMQNNAEKPFYQRKFADMSVLRQDD